MCEHLEGARALISRPSICASTLTSGTIKHRVRLRNCPSAASEYKGKEHPMARTGTFILASGDKFPQLAMDTVRHGPLTLPDALGSGWGVFLVYRAHW
jgi:hypothetical protein